MTTALEESTRRLQTMDRQGEIDAIYRTRTRLASGDYAIYDSWGGVMGRVVPRGGSGSSRRYAAQGRRGMGSRGGFKTIKEAVAWLVLNS